MINIKKKLYTNLGYSVSLTWIGDGNLEGIVESSALAWNKEGVCTNGDPDFNLTNKVSLFKISKPKVKKL